MRQVGVSESQGVGSDGYLAVKCCARQTREDCRACSQPRAGGRRTCRLVMFTQPIRAVVLISSVAANWVTMGTTRRPGHAGEALPFCSSTSPDLTGASGQSVAAAPSPLARPPRQAGDASSHAVGRPTRVRRRCQLGDKTPRRRCSIPRSLATQDVDLGPGAAPVRRREPLGASADLLGGAGAGRAGR
jgi:hypothetical protein